MCVFEGGGDHCHMGLVMVIVADTINEIKQVSGEEGRRVPGSCTECSLAFSVVGLTAPETDSRARVDNVKIRLTVSETDSFIFKEQNLVLKHSVL